MSRVYHSIPIDDFNLLTSAIFFTIFSVLMLGVLLFWAIFSYRNHWKVITPKEKSRLKKLESCGDDTRTQKELARRKRKEARKNKKSRMEWIEASAIMVLIMAVFLWCLIGLTIPAWTDYCRKDYSIYVGEFEVKRYNRGNWVELDNGVTLRGSDLPVGTYNGTVVYAHRSEYTLATLED